MTEARAGRRCRWWLPRGPANGPGPTPQGSPQHPRSRHPQLATCGRPSIAGERHATSRQLRRQGFPPVAVRLRLREPGHHPHHPLPVRAAGRRLLDRGGDPLLRRAPQRHRGRDPPRHLRHTHRLPAVRHRRQGVDGVPDRRLPHGRRHPRHAHGGRARLGTAAPHARKAALLGKSPLLQPARKDVRVQDQDFVQAFAARVAAFPGVLAVTLGGSRARAGPGEVDAAADWDFALYYRGHFDADSVRATGWEGEITDPGGWGGGVMNGGAWLRIDGRAVDLHYRDLDEVEHWWAEAREGRFVKQLLLFYLAGIPTYTVVGELALNRVLVGELPKPEYPEALALEAERRWHRDAL